MDPSSIDFPVDHQQSVMRLCTESGCTDAAIGKGRYCKKHRNKQYKQRYRRKKKREAAAPASDPDLEQAKRKLMEKVSQSQEAAGSASSEPDYKDLLHPVLVQKRQELLDSEEVILHLKREQEKVRLECEKKRRPKDEVLAEYQSLQDEAAVSAAKRQKSDKDTKHSDSSKDWTSPSETDTLDTSGTSHSSLNSSTGITDNKDSEDAVLEQHGPKST
ncbi:regulatory factor X-associated protein-like [Corticium candelabrum]|uniref:regulatory factor X-associated protein-like n=1 Tax=Corticium candelabrum TaxID=121492 RepID=UPI002E270406|nr:regulatory factor X-associated protein-like [Corticium candelabrum]